MTEKKERRPPEEYSEVMRHLKPNGNPLGQFIPYPKGYGVEILAKEEEMLLLVRKHWITNFKWVLVVIGLILAGQLIPWFPFFNSLPAAFQLMTTVFWYLIAVGVAMEGFFSWDFDVFVVTDERVIDIDFVNLIYKNITAAKIDKIEDVTYNVSGAVNSLLNFGTLLVQTAAEGMTVGPDGARGTLEIINIPRPAMVAKLINEMVLEEEQEQVEGRVR